MSKTLENIKALICKSEVRISEHGYDELLSDNLLAREIVEGVSEAVVVEDYPDYPKGSCLIVHFKQVMLLSARKELALTFMPF